MNAVYGQIWGELILTILLWINKILNGIAISIHEILIMIKSTLLTKNDLVGLCTNIPLSKLKDDELQPFLEGFIC